MWYPVRPQPAQGFLSAVLPVIVPLLLVFPQHLGDHRPVGRRPLCATDFSAAPSAETGALHARPPSPAGSPDEDNGQRSHLLHVAHALHLYLQVPEAAALPQLSVWLP